MFYGTSATVEIGDDPDWSDLHARFTSWSDDLGRRPRVETFAVRVACDEEP